MEHYRRFAYRADAWLATLAARLISVARSVIAASDAFAG